MTDDELVLCPLSLENVSEEGAARMVGPNNELDQNLLETYGAFHQLIPEELRPSIAFIVTGDMEASVASREAPGSRREAFTQFRGGGLVAAKNMPRSDGVDVLFQLANFLPDDDQTEEQKIAYKDHLRHLAAHEATHARQHRLDRVPYDPAGIDDLGWASKNYAHIAAYQVAEYFAEVSANAVARSVDIGPESLATHFDACETTITTRLPAMDGADPDYFAMGAHVSLTAVHDTWTILAYLAAELRDGDSFNDVPGAIQDLPQWKVWCTDWWPRYTAILGRLPMIADPPQPVTDELVLELAGLLKDWYLDLGFDFHDVDGGGFYFRVLREMPW